MGPIVGPTVEVREMHEDVPEPLLERLSAVVTELFNAANHALLNERGPAEECMQRAGAFLQKNEVLSAQLPSVQPLPNTQIRGGLAPWQIRKLTTFVDA